MTRRSVQRLLAASVLVLWGGVLNAPGASATSAGVITFTGQLFLFGCTAGPGLGNPGTLQGGAPNTTPEHCMFTFTANPTLPSVCTNTIANALKPPKPAVVIGATCTLTLTGRLTGFCANLFGAGSGGFVDSTGNVVTIPNFIFRDAPFVLTGAVAKGAQAGLLTAKGALTSPNALTKPAGGSCLTGTATTFTLTGTATFNL